MVIKQMINVKIRYSQGPLTKNQFNFTFKLIQILNFITLEKKN